MNQTSLSARFLTAESGKSEAAKALFGDSKKNSNHTILCQLLTFTFTSTFRCIFYVTNQLQRPPPFQSLWVTANLPTFCTKVYTSNYMVNLVMLSSDLNAARSTKLLKFPPYIKRESIILHSRIFTQF